METKKLGDFCKLRQGFQVPLPDQETELKDGYVRFIRIVDYTQETDDIRYVKNSEKFYYVEPDDVVMVRYGAAGEVGHGISGVIANNMFLIEPLIKINKDYLYYYLAQNKIRHKLLSSSTSTTMPALNFKIVNDLDVPLYEKDKQDEIVAILNKLSSVIEKRKNEIIALDELIKARFVEIFGDPVLNEKGWETRPFLDMGSCKNGMNFHYEDSGVELNCLGVGDFKDYSVITNTELLPTVSLNEMPSEEYLLRDDDIVFVRSNGNKALVGRSVAVYPGNTPTTFSGFCIRYRKHDDDITIPYLLRALKADSIRKKMAGRGANIQNLNQQILGTLIIPVPPLDLQKQFANFVKQVDKSKVAVEKALGEAQTLFDSLMQEYFG